MKLAGLLVCQFGVECLEVFHSLAEAARFDDVVEVQEAAEVLRHVFGPPRACGPTPSSFRRIAAAIPACALSSPPPRVPAPCAPLRVAVASPAAFEAAHLRFQEEAELVLLEVPDLQLSNLLVVLADDYRREEVPQVLASLLRQVVEHLQVDEVLRLEDDPRVLVAAEVVPLARCGEAPAAELVRCQCEPANDRGAPLVSAQDGHSR